MHQEIGIIDELRPHPEVERIFQPLPDDQQNALAQAMAHGRPFAPLLVDRQNRIMAGVETWRAARALGWRRISLVRAPRLDPRQAAALIVAENIATLELRTQHTYRAMNNFFDMAPLRPPGGW